MGVVNLVWVWTGLLMGLLGTPHCAAMCGALCAALARPGSGVNWGLHGARILSYAAGGAVAAAAVSGLSAWAAHSAWLRPLWLVLHLTFLGAGLFMFSTGRQVPWPAIGGALVARAMSHMKGLVLTNSQREAVGGRLIVFQGGAQPERWVAPTAAGRAWWLGLAWVRPW